MMNTPKTETHPVELLLIAGLALLWAVAAVTRLLLVPVVALIVAVLTPQRRPAPEPAPVAPAAAAGGSQPLMLADLAADLMALPAGQLQAMAGTRRRLAKAELTARICAMPI